MNLPTLVSSVVVGLLAGLLGLIVLAVITAMRAFKHLGQGVAPMARTAEKPTSPHARPGTDDAVVVKMPEGRHHDRGFEELPPAA